jgi:hypothetical protein
LNSEVGKAIKQVRDKKAIGDDNVAGMYWNCCEKMVWK